MRVLIVLEHRFLRTPDGRTWTEGPFPHSFFTRYLEVFEEAIVIARSHPVQTAQQGWQRSDGPGVRFAPIPSWVGATEYLLRRAAVGRALRQALDDDIEAAVILRIPSNLATLAARRLRGRPYAAEIVGDPREAWSPGAVRHPLRPYFQWAQARELRWLCGAACATGYVTEAALQRRYPPKQGAFTTHYSSVELPDEAFVDRSRDPVQRNGPLRLVCVGSMEHLYKGQDVLLAAVSICRGNGLLLELSLIGDGRYRPFLEQGVADLGLEEQVELRGWLAAGPAVRDELDRADVFVLPSRQEGLPRALLEAMARGLPAVSTAVGGIPEVISAEDLVPPNDPGALAARIETLAASPTLRAATGARNLARARDFRNAALQGRRNDLFRGLLDDNRNWLARGLRQAPLQQPSKG